MCTCVIGVSNVFSAAGVAIGAHLTLLVLHQSPEDPFSYPIFPVIFGMT